MSCDRKYGCPTRRTLKQYNKDVDIDKLVSELGLPCDGDRQSALMCNSYHKADKFQPGL